MAKKTLRGPGGLHVELDTDQVFPDDPGNGTPALVYNARRTHNATFQCALGTGELLGFGADDSVVLLGNESMKWLESIEDEVYKFLPGW